MDSGLAGIFDAEKYRPEDKEWYNLCYNITMSRDGAGVLDGGAVSESGYGDGVYACYKLEENGEIVAVKVVFV